MNTALHLWVAVRTRLVTTRDALLSEAGEGVISTAIAVLIIALIGALMWVAFQAIFTDASTRANDAVTNIG